MTDIRGDIIMVSGTVSSTVENSEKVFEGVRFAVDVWNNIDQVIIQVGNQEATISKETFLKMSSLIEEAKLSNKEIPLNISKGKVV